jgi:WD40 repeat protein
MYEIGSTMTPSNRKSSWSPHRFYDYLKCLREEFEHMFTDDMSSRRRFNIYLGNLKGEFELVSLEIESLQKERDEYRERGLDFFYHCGFTNDLTTVEAQIKKRPQIAIPSSPKIIKTGPRLSFQSQTLDMPKLPGSSKDVDMTQETTTSTHRSSQHTTLIQKLHSAITPTRPLSLVPASHAVTKNPSKEGGQMIDFSNEVEKALDVEIAHTLFHSKPMRIVKFSRDGKYLAGGCADGKAYIYDVQEEL